MCIAILNKKGKISAETIRICFENNPDGAGLSWIDNTGKIHIYKTLTDVENYIDTYQKVRKSNDKPILLHFRIATTGSVCLDNTHPFIVNNNTVLCHNGMITIDIPKNTDVSDTRAFNDEILKHLDMSKKFNQLLVSKFIGYSKLILLNSDSTFSIINENLGKWDKDKNNWYSNDSYKPTEPIKYTNYQSNKDWNKQYNKPLQSYSTANNYCKNYDWNDLEKEEEEYYKGVYKGDISMSTKIEELSNKVFDLYQLGADELTEEQSSILYDCYDVLSELAYNVEINGNLEF